MVFEGHLSAMLDWELAHLGDPHEDLAWLWMRGAHTDFGDPARRIAEYEAAAGAPLDRSRLAWHLAFVMWKSVVSIRAMLRESGDAETAIIQTVVALTYEALLGSQLVELTGGSLRLLADPPIPSPTTAARIADRALGAEPVPRSVTLALELLRDSAANTPWEYESQAADCRRLLDIDARELPARIAAADPSEFPALAEIVGRAGDRAAWMTAKAVRRIERAQRIGLGIGTELA